MRYLAHDGGEVTLDVSEAFERVSDAARDNILKNEHVVDDDFLEQEQRGQEKAVEAFDRMRESLKTDDLAFPTVLHHADVPSTPAHEKAIELATQAAETNRDPMMDDWAREIEAAAAIVSLTLARRQQLVVDMADAGPQEQGEALAQALRRWADGNGHDPEHVHDIAETVTDSLAVWPNAGSGNSPK